MVITQIFHPILELLNTIGIPTKEAKVEKETHQVVVEVAISKWLISFKTLQTIFILLTP